MSGTDRGAPPLVSIVVCCYNQRQWVRQAVESALGQTHPGIEVLAIDNGSTDGSADELRRFADDPRVTLFFHEENAAPTGRINQAIQAARGDYTAILYADDYYLPELIERELRCFRDLPEDYGVVYSPGYRLNVDNGATWLPSTFKESGWILERLLTQCYKVGFINPISPLMRRECLRRHPLRTELYSEGEAVFLRLAMTYRFQHLDEPLVVQRDHSMNTGKAFKKNSENFLAMMRLLAAEPEFPRGLVPTLNGYVAQTMRNYGYQGIRIMRDRAWSLDCYRLALRLQPLQLLHPRTLAGLFMNLLPEPLLSGVLAALDRIRRNEAVVTSRKDWS